MSHIGCVVAANLISLSTAIIVVFNPCYLPIKSLLLGTKLVFKHQDLLKFGLKLNNMSNFHPLDVVGRGSETQRQVGEKLICLFSAYGVNYPASCKTQIMIYDSHPKLADMALKKIFST